MDQQNNDFYTKMAQFDATIEQLNQQLNKAQQDHAVAVSNLAQLNESKQKLEEDCSRMFGISLGELGEVVQKDCMVFEQVMNKMTEFFNHPMYSPEAILILDETIQLIQTIHPAKE